MSGRRVLGLFVVAGALIGGSCWSGAQSPQDDTGGTGGPTPGLPIEVGPDGNGNSIWKSGANQLSPGYTTDLREQLARVVIKLEAVDSSDALHDIVYARVPLQKGSYTYQIEFSNRGNDLRVDVFKGTARQELQLCNSGSAPALSPCRKADSTAGGSGIPDFLFGAKIGTIYAEKTGNVTVSNVTRIKVTPE